jgi:membrane associated rhomboid family serine protease
MLLFPYKADVDLGRWPVMTMAVCGICIYVFIRQLISQHDYNTALNRFCNHEISRDERIVQRYLEVGAEAHYCDVLLDSRAAPNRKQAIGALAASARPLPFYSDPATSREYIAAVLTESSRRFERTIPHNLTEDLRYDPKTLDITRMITAAFTHGSWSHLIFNLIFFFAFAASVEVITGYFYYLFFIVFAAVGTHLAYRYSVRDIQDAAPTVGLSGVVMAMMAFLATVMPSLSIRVFFWFIWIVKIFRVPALIIAALYIGENIYDYLNRDANSNVNYMAHISGAAIGVSMGLLYRLRHRELLRELAAAA